MKKIVTTPKEYAKLTEPPRQFLQVVKYKGIDPKARRFKSIFWEGYDLRETVIIVRTYVVYIRIFYPTRLLDFIEEIRRPLWMKWQFVKEMWYRKTFRITEEQVHQRLAVCAQKALTISFKPDKPKD